MKHYPPEFKADAVALYRSRPDATIAQIATELGINRATLRIPEGLAAEGEPWFDREAAASAPGESGSSAAA